MHNIILVANSKNLKKLKGRAEQTTPGKRPKRTKPSKRFEFAFRKSFPHAHILLILFILSLKFRQTYLRSQLHWISTLVIHTEPTIRF